MDDTLAVLPDVVDAGEELEDEDLFSGTVLVASDEDVAEAAEVVLVGVELLVVTEDELEAVKVSHV